MKNNIDLIEGAFSNRTIHILRREKITTVKQYLALTKKEILSWPGAGIKVYNELNDKKEVMSELKYGMALTMKSLYSYIEKRREINKYIKILKADLRAGKEAYETLLRSEK